MTRLLEYMDEHGFRSATPQPPAGMGRRPLLTLMAGYLKRASHLFPAQGDSGAWFTTGDYLQERWAVPRADVTDDMEFRSQ